MCGRYVIASKYERIKEVFNHPILSGPEFEPNYFVLPGEYVPVISSENPNRIEMMRFGFTPHWGEKKHFAINARAEGNGNKSNSPLYKGGFGILQKPFYKTAIRKRRCLIIADAFIEGSKKLKLKEPFLIYPKNKKRPFTMAGVWEEWKNPVNNQTERGFAIITYHANDLMQRIGHHRSPIIIPPDKHNSWLNPDTALMSITKMLNVFDYKRWNAFRLDPLQMITKTANGLKAVSEPIYPEFKDINRPYTQDEIEKGLHLPQWKRPKF